MAGQTVAGAQQRSTPRRCRYAPRLSQIIHSQASSEAPAFLQGAGAEDHLLQVDTTTPEAASAAGGVLEKADLGSPSLPLRKNIICVMK
jgi:hypothetical protein